MSIENAGEPLDGHDATPGLPSDPQRVGRKGDLINHHIPRDSAVMTCVLSDVADTYTGRANKKQSRRKKFYISAILADLCY